MPEPGEKWPGWHSTSSAARWASERLLAGAAGVAHKVKVVAAGEAAAASIYSVLTCIHMSDNNR